MRTLDRYVLQNFLVPLFYCVLGFIAILFVFDLGDNGGEFIEARVPISAILAYYGSQIPQLLVMSTPVGLLLSLLYCLSRMSRSNEIISMLTAGRSVIRILTPLMIAGLVAAAASMKLNYELAPHGDGAKKAFLDEIKGGKKNTRAEMLFINRAEHRMWYVKKMPKRVKSERPIDLDGVYVRQSSEDGSTEKFYAQHAVFYPGEKAWQFEHGKSVKSDKAGKVESEDLAWLNGSRRITGWSETPWRIASSNLDPQFLSVPELADYLRFNSDFPRVQLAPYLTHWHYRWALPLSCFVVIFIAAPLGIVYSRRGVLAGVAGSILIFFAMMFLDKLFLALGKGGRVPAVVGAWGPDILFGVVGVLLLYLRSTNRELPSLAGLFRRKKLKST